MNSIRWRLVVAAGALVVTGCTTAAEPPPVGYPATLAAQSSPTVSASSLSTGLPTAPPAPPIDPSIQQVSAAHPASDAQQALQLCEAYDLGLDRVSGMGLIPRARNAVNYARLSALAPFLASDSPAWVVQFRGQVNRLPLGQGWIDPTCVVIDGTQQFFATGPVVDLATGHLVRRYWPANPSWSLPPLGP